MAGQRSDESEVFVELEKLEYCLRAMGVPVPESMLKVSQHPVGDVIRMRGVAYRSCKLAIA